MNAAYRIVLASLLAVSCGGSSSSLVDVPTPVRADRTAPAGLELWLRADAEPRFFPALGVLHEPGGPRPGRDFRLDSSGRATRMEGDPFASERDRVFIDVVGDWPRAAWARATARLEPGPQRLLPEHQIIEWRGTSWESRSAIGELLAPVPPPSDEVPPPAPVTRATLVDLAPWGREGAIAMTFDFSETAKPPATPENPRRSKDDESFDFEESCHQESQAQLGSVPAAPRMGTEACLSAPHAIGVSPARDVFVVAQTRLGRPFAKQLITWGPLEVRRWAPGATVPARDELEPMLSFRPGVLDSWATRTLLVNAADDAYLAVAAAPPSAAISGATFPVTSDIALLHFDGKRWTEALRVEPPWRGMERAPDGSVWLVAGNGLFVAAGQRAGRPRFVPVPVDAASGEGKTPVEPLHVLPWSATRASVIGRAGSALGLFTVVRADDATSERAPLQAPRSFAAARATRPAVRQGFAPLSRPPAGAFPSGKTKVMKISPLNVERATQPGRPYLIISGNKRFEGLIPADGLVVENVADETDVLELHVWGGDSPVPSQSWRSTIVAALPPASTPSGARVRLANLAYEAGPPSDDLDDSLRYALRRFQEEQHLPQTGLLDAVTVAKLREIYGH